jgi:hypothetical protein
MRSRPGLDLLVVHDPAFIYVPQAFEGSGALLALDLLVPGASLTAGI